MLKYNNIEICIIRKIHIINILQKITLKMGLFGGLWNSIFAPIFQISAKFSGSRSKKSRKIVLFRAKKPQKTKKMHFYLADYQQDKKKMQKK